ncbi:DMT family transporter [Oceanobacillus polygoni]|uniref:Drug/metabolite transporter (DMT)-like permease n=1 Tax=Oceanobacillus polygoni TaxID=1235259 RepID=A0A9X0YTS7_9BACI|nr:EamA family transporter [Oceanobacillus polygoni]MBP2077931.1 drug/metabolite transporter (DMT)-like permease [Oceanobacillus polygoni]
MNKPILFIILGAALWGTIGWFVKQLYAFGFTPMEVVTLRVWSSAIILIIYMFMRSPSNLKLKHYSDMKYFIGTGVCSIIFFNYCMFTAIELSTIPIATALLYTGPAFVMIISFFLFKEPFTQIKVIALFMTLLGTCFVVGLSPGNLNNLDFVSILFGLGSGLGYALYSIFSKFSLKKYSSLQVTSFTFIVAAVALLPFFPYQEKISLLFNGATLFYAVGLGLFPTALAYILYTNGLQYTEASKASILSTVEPVVATLIGIFIFLEPFTYLQMLGMGCIIGAVFIVQLYGRRKLSYQQ